MKLGLLHLCENYEQSKIYSPNGLAYLSSFLHKYLNNDIEIFLDDDVEKLLSLNLDIIGISSYTENFNKADNLSKYIKKKYNIPIIIGGPHITVMPQTLPSSIDIGIIGEGEKTFLEIIKLFLSDSLNSNNLEKIQGIVYHENGRLKITGVSPVFNELDMIPFPDRFLFNRFDKEWQQTIITARGCPFKCIFCASSKIWGKPRFHSPERVVSEIQEIIRNYPNQTWVPISDDLFTLRLPRLRKIVSLIRQENIHKRLNFICTARASNFDEDTCKLLYDMNVRIIGFGLETFSSKILKYLKGKSSTPDKNQKAIDLCHKYGINVVSNFIIGTPIEDKQDLAKTYWGTYKNRNKIWRFNFCIATPLPGTKLWEYALEKNLIKPDFNEWEKLNLQFDLNNTIFLNQSNFDRLEFYKIYLTFKNHADSFGIKAKEILFQRQKMREYLELTYKKINNIIPNDIKNNIKNVLEISTFPKKLIEDLDLNYDKIKTVLDIDKSIEKGDFDLIFVSHFLEKMKYPQKTIYNLKRYIRKNGYLLLLVFNVRHSSFLIEFLLNKLETGVFNIYNMDYLSFFTKQRIINLLQNSGFKIINIIENTIDIDIYKPILKILIHSLAEKINTNNFEKEKNIISYLILAKEVA